MRTNEIIALAVAVLAALALVTTLLVAKGRAAGLPGRRRRSLVVQFWAAVLVAVAIMVLSRVIIGTEVLSGEPGRGMQVAALGTWQWVVVGVALAGMLVCMWWARNVVAQVDVPGHGPLEPVEDGEASDEDRHEC